MKTIQQHSLAQRPLAGVVMFFCAGILVDKFIALSFTAYVSLGALVLLLAAIFFRRKTLCGFLILLSFLCLGAVFSRNFQYAPPDDIVRVAKYYRGRPVLLEGIVVSDIQTRKVFRTTKTSLELRVTRLKTKWGWKKKTGKILVNVFRDVPVNYGDHIRIEGKLHRPFRMLPDSKFSYAQYLKARKINLILSAKKSSPFEVLKSGGGWSLKALSIGLKNRFKEIFDEHLSKSEAGLMQALIIGDRYDIPQNIMILFVQTGTAHILAISGFNVGIIAFLVLLFFRILPVGRKIQLVLTIIVLIFYAVLTGLRPPVVRATIMAVVFLSSFLVEREPDVINSLSFAALLILLFNPLYLFDVGFQLSFISVLFMVIFYQRILSVLLRGPEFLQKQPFLFCMQSLAVSLAAWVGVAGLIALYFGIVTPVTILANLAVIPLISLVTILGVGMLAGSWIPGCAMVFAVCLKVLLNLTVFCIYLFSFVPGSYFYLPSISVWAVVGYYGAISLIELFGRQFRRLIFRFTPVPLASPSVPED